MGGQPVQLPMSELTLHRAAAEELGCSGVPFVHVLVRCPHMLLLL